MKILDKITLVLFSIIILISTILITLLIFGWVRMSSIVMFVDEMSASALTTNITLGVSVLCALLSIRAIFFGGARRRG